jgi:hypothetical protein
MKASDPILQRIEEYFEDNDPPIVIRRANKGYSLFFEGNSEPVARFRPRSGEGEEVEILWWSHRDKWERIGDFGGVILPLDKALDYVASDTMGCFWIRAPAVITTRWRGLLKKLRLLQ